MICPRQIVNNISVCQGNSGVSMIASGEGRNESRGGGRRLPAQKRGWIKKKEEPERTQPQGGRVKKMWQLWQQERQRQLIICHHPPSSLGRKLSPTKNKDSTCAAGSVPSITLPSPQEENAGQETSEPLSSSGDPVVVKQVAPQLQQ